MLKCQGILTLIGAVLLLAVGSSRAMGQDTKPAKKSGKLSGVLISKSNDSIMVHVDKEEEPTKFTIDEKNKKQAAQLKGVFDGGRVQLTYKTEGDNRQLVGITRQVLQQTGTVTGTVVKVHNDFWFEVKLKSGLYEGFAPNGRNYKDKAFMDRLKALQSGDTVTVQFTTDGERHRIVAFKKK